MTQTLAARKWYLEFPLEKHWRGRGHHSVWTDLADLRSLTIGSKKTLLPEATSHRRLGGGGEPGYTEFEGGVY